MSVSEDSALQMKFVLISSSPLSTPFPMMIKAKWNSRSWRDDRQKFSTNCVFSFLIRWFCNWLYTFFFSKSIFFAVLNLSFSHCRVGKKKYNFEFLILLLMCCISFLASDVCVLFFFVVGYPTGILRYCLLNLIHHCGLLCFCFHLKRKSSRSSMFFIDRRASYIIWFVVQR